MSEATIPVQPAATQGAPAPAPMQLKMFLVPAPNADGSGSMVQVQAMCLVDDQGRAYQPMSEATGRDIVRLLRHIARSTANAAGLLEPADDAGFNDQ